MAGRKKAKAADSENINTSDTPRFRVSVRSLVAFSIPNDETWGFSTYRMAHEGSRAHSKLQAINKQEGIYESEVFLSRTFEVKDCILEVTGRADGIWREKGRVIVEEIKTSATPLAEIHEDFSESHWAQGKCYAYLLAENEDLDRITVRLTYYDPAKEELKSFDRNFTLKNLKSFISKLIHAYVTWALSVEEWKQVRNLSIKALTFPYPSYRKGQKLLSYNVYKCIEDEKRLFVQAPTGTGKTIGVLYPAIKSLGEGKLDRIFYITAKTTTRGIAEKAYKLLEQQGLRLKVLSLTAKDKQCLNEIKNCTPEHCPFIEGFQYRSKRVVKSLLKKHDFFSRETIREAALRHNLCPFELSLDLALSCDLIICDYNYVFDPRVYLKRFFQQKGYEEYLILVDEAHNLFDRTREMYSASICVKELSEIIKEIKKDLPDITKSLRGLKKAMSSIEKSIKDDLLDSGGQSYYASSDAPGALKEPLEDFIIKTENWMITNDEEKPYAEKLATLFFDLLHFKNILGLFSPQYRTFITGQKSSLKLSLLCMDPAPMLDRTMSTARCTVLFSATLSPLWYFKSILGGRSEDVTLRLPSPFPRENLLLVNEDTIETRYHYRAQFLHATAKAIYDWSMGRKGNIMVFFPSYKYLLDVLGIFREFEGDYEILCQDRDMDEPSRDAFLAEFEKHGDRTRIAFCVMGGVFGEGIDLTGNRLTGVIIIGVGLPQVCPEQEILRAYFDSLGKSGFTFAYTYPGINKVLQAAGRLIRTETDRGALLLIDSRFATYEYQKLLPEEWSPIPRTSMGISLSEAVKKFWDQFDSDTPMQSED